MESQTVSVSVQKFLTLSLPPLGITRPISALTDPVTIPPIWASEVSDLATLRSQDLSVALTCGETTRESQRSNPEMQQQDNSHQHSHRKTPGASKPAGTPTLDLQVPARVPKHSCDGKPAGTLAPGPGGYSLM
ncbi:Hypothetical predicted protein, partial [Marmota monax]